MKDEQSLRKKISDVRPDDQKKLNQIWSCLEGKKVNGQKEIDLWELRDLAISPGGLLQPEVRQIAWPKLLGISLSDKVTNNSICSSTEHSLKKGKRELSQDERVTIQQDVKRSIWRLDEHLKQIKTSSQTTDVDSQKDVTKTTWILDDHLKWIKTTSQTTVVDSNFPSNESILESTIIEALLQCPTELHYYQGYHDIASLMLLNLKSTHLTSKVLSQISSYHLHDYMQKTMRSTISLLQLVLYVLLRETDEELLDHLLHTGLDLSSFTLSWVISWFTHDIKTFEITSRIMDLCIASHPAMPMYLSVTMLLQNRVLILNTDCEVAAIYDAIQKLPKSMIDEDMSKGENNVSNLIDDWICAALSLMERISPQEVLSIAEQYEDDEYIQSSLVDASGTKIFNSVSSQHFSLAMTTPIEINNPFVSLQINDDNDSLLSSLPTSSSISSLSFSNHKQRKNSFIKQLKKKSTSSIKHQSQAIIAAGKRKEYKSIIDKRKRFRRLKFISLRVAVTSIASLALRYHQNRDNFFNFQRSNIRFHFSKITTTSNTNMPSLTSKDALPEPYISEIMETYKGLGEDIIIKEQSDKSISDDNGNNEVKSEMDHQRYEMEEDINNGNEIESKKTESIGTTMDGVSFGPISPEVVKNESEHIMVQSHSMDREVTLNIENIGQEERKQEKSSIDIDHIQDLLSESANEDFPPNLDTEVEDNLEEIDHAVDDVNHGLTLEDENNNEFVFNPVDEVTFMIK